MRSIKRLVVAVVLLAACGGPGPAATVSPSPPPREMKLAISGALSGADQVETSSDNRCGTQLPDEPHSVNYIFQGHVEGLSRDIKVDLNFSVHRYARPGTFMVGAYPAGSITAPAIASVANEITAKNILIWISGSGSLVVDVGARSGTVDLKLSSTSGLAELDVSGTWVCAGGP
jgi:hypothetical protein